MVIAGGLTHRSAAGAAARAPSSRGSVSPWLRSEAVGYMWDGSSASDTIATVLPGEVWSPSANSGRL
jgi:hypothetical protein